MGTGSSAIAKIKQVGNDYFKEGDYSKASKAYSKALKYDPSNGLILSNRSACYLKLLKYKQSIDDALSCISVLPDWHKSYYRLAVSLKACNLITESLINAQKSLYIQEDSSVRALLQDLQSQHPAPCRNNLLIWGTSHIRPTHIKELEGIPVLEVACGISHTIALSLNSFVYAWGDNSHNQCGLDGSCTSPRLVTKLLTCNVTAIISGGGHSLAICQNGEVYAWGINKQGQCGSAGPVPYPSLIQVPGKVKGGSAGLLHSALLLADNCVCVAGGNFNGQLGNGLGTFLTAFTKVGVSGNFISCGAVHTLVVTQNGELLATGGNSCGQLGVGDLNDRNVFTKVRDLSDISICRCGEEFSVAVTSTSLVYTFGLGNVGQLGTSTSQSCVPILVSGMTKNLATEYVACTKGTVMAVTRNLETYVWGLVPDYSSASSKSVLPEKLQILKTKKVKEIQCMRDTFFIMTEYVLNNSYVIGLPLRPVEAGKKHTAHVNLIDSRSMFVLEPIDKIGVICFDDSGKLSNGEVLAFWDNSNHVIELRINQAGYHYLYVFVNGVLLKTAPYIYTVGHTVFCKAIGFVASDKALVNAGCGFVILVKIFDKFDNLVLGEPGLEFKPSVGKCEIVDFQEGCYRVKVVFTEIGEHCFRIESRGVDIVFAVEDYADPKNVVVVKKVEFVEVQVLPGVVFWEKCCVEGLKEVYQVGEEVKFRVAARDQYGNTTWHRQKPWDLQIPFSTEISESIDSCSTVITGKSNKSGSSPIKIGYNSQFFFSKTITFLPGPVHLPHTQVSGEGQKNFYFTEPCKKSFELEFFDEYFNSSPTELSLTSNVEYTLNKLSPSLYQLQYSLNSSKSIQFSFTTSAGVYEVNIKVEKDPALVKQELREIELEKKRQEMLRLEKLRLELEEKARAEEEQRRKLELRNKEKALQDSLDKQKLMEDTEMKRRQRIVEKIKMQEMTKKRAEEALKKLEEEKAAKPPKKFKRTGGGFVVPFTVEDL